MRNLFTAADLRIALDSAEERGANLSQVRIWVGTRCCCAEWDGKLGILEAISDGTRNGYLNGDC